MARAVRIQASWAPRPLTPANMAGEMVACSHSDIWAKRSLAHVLYTMGKTNSPLYLSGRREGVSVLASHAHLARRRLEGQGMPDSTAISILASGPQAATG
eukprot:13812333-Alexandrium_andersonii.AAC.1